MEKFEFTTENSTLTLNI